MQVEINGSEVTVKGPKGEMKRVFSPDITITQEDGDILVKCIQISRRFALCMVQPARSL